MESTSRIYVRGLPPKMTAEDFRKRFSNLAPITDAKYLPRRRIGYVGYKTSEDAARAIKYHHKTFVGLSRISVEFAQPFEGRKPTQFQHESSENSYESSGHGTSNDQPQEQIRPEQPSYPVAEQSYDHKRKPSDGREDSDGLRGEQELAEVTTKRRKLGEVAAGHVHETSAMSREPANNDIQPSVNVETVESTYEKGPKLDTTTDEDWLRSRTSRVLDLLDEEVVVVRQDRESEPEKAMAVALDEEESSLKPENPDVEGHHEDSERSAHGNIGETESSKADLITNRLFLRNLLYTATEEDLRHHFESLGHSGFTGVHVPTDSRSGANKGFAYVEFADSHLASLALRDLDQKPFQGRILHVLPSETKKEHGLDEFEISMLPLKKQQAVKRKADAAKFTFNWNSMYMNTDAIMSSLSNRLGVSKSDLMDPTSSDAAIKQAHAETHVIQEAKAYFAANGVNTEAFKRGERGGTALLVKNFPYGTSHEDLMGLFEAYGTVRKLLMPEAGTIAIVDFQQEDHARSAFHGLAYRRLSDSILFLEKAPKGLLGNGTHLPQPGLGDGNQNTKTSSSDLLEPEQLSNAETSTLYVRNLNFATTDERLREAFQPLSGYLSARLKTKADPKKPGQMLSMGFGFVELRSKEQAQAALAAMNGQKLDGHELVIRPSQKTVDAAEERRRADRAKKAASRKTKIIIKNLPFEVTKKDVRSLFGAYGQLRSVRTPKKFDGSTRGFAFADFITAREAENAMDALTDTHFLGRRLVLEFATEETTDPEAEIAAMQQKVGRQIDKVALQELTGTGRKKFSVEGADEGFSEL